MKAAKLEAVLGMVRAAPGATAAELVIVQAVRGVAAPDRLDAEQMRRALTDLKAAGRVRKGESRECHQSGRRILTWFPTEA